MVDQTGLKPRKAAGRFQLKIVVATAWLAFTLTLTGWWLIFGLRQLQQLEDIMQGNSVLLESLHRQHLMLVSEGAVLFVLILTGGAVLIYGVRAEGNRARRVEEFFASFTHDLKTSLASLRIQTESLLDELGAAATQEGTVKILKRLMHDTGRLETQLENALYLAEAERGSLLLEVIDVAKAVGGLAHLWPNLHIQLVGEPALRICADRRAFDSILRNIAQNAIKHGQADQLTIESQRGSRDRVRLIFRDSGKGFHGDDRRLGEMFRRHSGTSGSGIGLFLVAQLAEKQGGRVWREPTTQGFAIGVEFKAAEEGEVA